MAKQRIVHPFADQGNYTSVHNAVFDVMLPALPPNAFKVLCFIIRQTRGWRRERAQLSYTEIARGTGIRSSATLAEAIKALLCKEYIVAKPSDDRWDATDYGLNTDLEIDVSTTENEVEPTSKTKAEPALVFEVDTALETEAIPTSKTKESIGRKKREEKKTPPPTPANGHTPNGGGGDFQTQQEHPKTERTDLYHWLRSVGVDSPLAAERNQYHDLALTQAMFKRMVGESIGDERKKRIGRFIRALEADGPAPPRPTPPPAAPAPPAWQRDDAPPVAETIGALKKLLPDRHKKEHTP